MAKFKQYVESHDLFGFGRKESERELLDKEDQRSITPIRRFDLELMMDFLSRKKLGVFEAAQPFLSEIRWGSKPGAIKLEVDTGLTFFIKKLAMDKEGNPRWVAKKTMQLNRLGFGGSEDSVAQEVFEMLEKYNDGTIESPVEEYRGLRDLVEHMYNKMKRFAKEIFYPQGIRKLSEDSYIISFAINGTGTEAPNQQRVEDNQTIVSYDKEAGVIHVCNQNIISPVGKRRAWNIKQSDLDLYFLPTQPKEEISDCVATHMRYY